MPKYIHHVGLSRARAKDHARQCRNTKQFKNVRFHRRVVSADGVQNALYVVVVEPATPEAEAVLAEQDAQLLRQG